MWVGAGLGGGKDKICGNGSKKEEKGGEGCFINEEEFKKKICIKERKKERRMPVTS